MNEVDLNVGELDDEKVKMLLTCLHNIETLKLRKLTLEGIERISGAINRASQPVIILGFFHQFMAQTTFGKEHKIDRIIFFFCDHRFSLKHQPFASKLAVWLPLQP